MTELPNPAPEHFEAIFQNSPLNPYHEDFLNLGNSPEKFKKLYEAYYQPLFQKEPRLISRLLSLGSIPHNLKVFFHDEIREFQEVSFRGREMEKQIILNGKLWGLLNYGHPDAGDLYKIHPSIWKFSRHPLIQNLRNARYLHHEDPDIIRAVEIFKMGSKMDKNRQKTTQAATQ